MKSSLNNVALGSLLASACALFAAFGVNASAATSTSNLAVTATVAANCTISAGSVAFGAYDPIVVNATNAKTATGTVTTTCTNGSAAYITLSQGLNPATGSTDAAPVRQMLSGSNALAAWVNELSEGSSAAIIRAPKLLASRCPVSPKRSTGHALAPVAL